MWFNIYFYVVSSKDHLKGDFFFSHLRALITLKLENCRCFDGEKERSPQIDLTRVRSSLVDHLNVCERTTNRPHENSICSNKRSTINFSHGPPNNGLLTTSSDDILQVVEKGKIVRAGMSVALIGSGEPK